MRRGLLIIAMLTIPITVQAHDTTDIEAWLETWANNTPPAGMVLGSAHHEALQDFIVRHRWFFDPEPTYVAPRRDWGGTVEEWRPLVAEHFRPDDVNTALCLIYHESRGDPSAKNPRSTASGLFQILRFWWVDFGLDPFVPEHNAWMAAQIRDIQGWWAWSPYGRGLCRGL